MRLIATNTNNFETRRQARPICACLAAVAVFAAAAHAADAAPSARGWDGSAWLSVPDAPVVDGVIHEDEPAAPGTSWFVRELVNEGEVASARWTTAGLGVYELYVNGTRVGDDFLKPGFTHPEKTKISFSYDVTKLLRRGKGETNVLAAAVSAGWWRDKILTPLGTPDLLSTNGLYRLPPTWCRDKMVPGRRGFIGRKSAFRGVLDVRSADGATRRVGTDTAHWKAGIAGPVTLASIFEGEHYDARRRPGFDRAVYSAFGRPEVNAEFAGEILPTDGAEVVLREDLTLKPVRAYAWKGVDGAGDAAYGKVRVVREFAPEGPFAVGAGETLVVDFGQNAAAVPRFAFAAPAGTVLEARPAEMLNDANGLKARGNDGPEGSVYRVNLRAGYETGRLVRYTFAGKAVEDYLPRFTYFGYRYVSVTATAPVTILRLESVPVTSIRREMERGRIVTGDAAVNRLVANVWWGQLSNYLSVPTDCPQRNERLGWTADTQVFCEAAGYNADVTDFLRKWMRDLRDSQDARGGFPGVAPRAQYGGAFMRIGWADAGVIVPYQAFRQSGDRRIVDENWDAMARFVAHVAATRYAHEAIKGECDDFQWGDWLSLTRIESAPYRPEYAACVTGPGGSRTPKPEAIRYWNYLGGCYWAMDAQMMAEMAALTGRADAAAKYRAMAAEATAYLKATFLAADGTLDPLFAGMQTPALFALKLGLVEGAAKAKTLEGLKASVAACGGTLHTGFLGTSIVMDTLTENGLSTLAYDLLLNRKFPGWLYSVDQGATTVWERWNSYTRQDGFGPAGMNSFNHYAYGAVLAWLYKTAAGIASDPAAPGFRRVVLAPKPDRRLGFVAADYRSAAGAVRSAWRYEGAKWIWNFTVPEGATAAVTAPGEAAATDYGPGEHEIVRDAL